MSATRQTAAALLALGMGMAMPAHADLGDVVDQVGQILSGSFENLSSTLGYLLTRLAQESLEPTEGTLAIADAVEHQGVARPLLIIEPAAGSAEKAPLIVLLHFSGGDAELMANLARAGRLTAEHGAWIVLPEETHHRWSDDPAISPSSDDVDFLAKAIAHMTTTYPVDPRRVYMAGMSNGGSMTERFACEKPELIAAAAVDAATLRISQDQACAPSRAVPMLHFAGTQDLLIPYSHPITMLSAQDTFLRWSDIHGCDLASRQDSALAPIVDDGTSIQLSENWDCSSGGAVGLYSIIGGGHAWPGSVGTLSIGRTTHNLDATEAMWAFFSQFSL